MSLPSCADDRPERRGSPGRGADRLNGGPGNDTMLAGRDDGAVDAIDCGSGAADHAVIRTGDSAVNCEVVDTIS
jgi:hypothetical protein